MPNVIGTVPAPGFIKELVGEVPTPGSISDGFSKISARCFESAAIGTVPVSRVIICDLPDNFERQTVARTADDARPPCTSMVLSVLRGKVFWRQPSTRNRVGDNVQGPAAHDGRVLGMLALRAARACVEAPTPR
jgi:hypothetical protein